MKEMSQIEINAVLFDEVAQLRAENKTLKEFRDAVTQPMIAIQAVHAHECPYWRVGTKKHGPCNCGAKEAQEPNPYP